MYFISSFYNSHNQMPADSPSTNTERYKEIIQLFPIYSKIWHCQIFHQVTIYLCTQKLRLRPGRITALGASLWRNYGPRSLGARGQTLAGNLSSLPNLHLSILLSITQSITCCPSLCLHGQNGKPSKHPLPGLWTVLSPVGQPILSQFARGQTFLSIARKGKKP